MSRDERRSTVSKDDDGFSSLLADLAQRDPAAALAPRPAAALIAVARRGVAESRAPRRVHAGRRLRVVLGGLALTGAATLAILVALGVRRPSSPPSLKVLALQPARRAGAAMMPYVDDRVNAAPDLSVVDAGTTAYELQAPADPAGALHALASALGVVGPVEQSSSGTFAVTSAGAQVTATTNDGALDWSYQGADTAPVGGSVPTAESAESGANALLASAGAADLVGAPPTSSRSASLEVDFALRAGSFSSDETAFSFV